MLLIKYNCNYADEFDIHDFVLETKEVWDDVCRIAKLLDGEEQDFSFGTNEYITVDMNNFPLNASVTEISNEEYEVLKKYLGNHETFILDSIIEHYYIKEGEIYQEWTENQAAIALLRMAKNNSAAFNKLRSLYNELSSIYKKIEMNTPKFPDLKYPYTNEEYEKYKEEKTRYFEEMDKIRQKWQNDRQEYAVPIENEIVALLNASNVPFATDFLERTDFDYMLEWVMPKL